MTQIALGRFHHFHLARQLEARGRLKEIWSGYPKFKLKDEVGIAPGKVRSFPWFYVPSVTLRRLPVVGRSQRLGRDLHWAAVEAIDSHVAQTVKDPGVLVGLSSGGLRSGSRMRERGGFYVCDRGSTHIRFQHDILSEEYRIWGLDFEGIDPRVLAKEEAEYAAADRITVPSQFCHDSFVARGVPPEKLRVVPYGGRLDRFGQVGEPDRAQFTVLFVGGVSLRKGVPYLLQAFARLKHPKKVLKIVGAVQDDVAHLLGALPRDHVEFVGPVPNQQLAGYYNAADVMVLPSIEEGLSLVMAEAMACGCPVIASANTGAHDLFDHGDAGFIVPIRSVDALLEALEQLAQDPDRRSAMRTKARRRIEGLGGYDLYGARWAALLDELAGRQLRPRAVAKLSAERLAAGDA